MGQHSYRRKFGIRFILGITQASRKNNCVERVQLFKQGRREGVPLPHKQTEQCAVNGRLEIPLQPSSINQVRGRALVPVGGVECRCISLIVTTMSTIH